ncbi:hypothetical protein ABTN03_20140, partial [Acinetobacter baumannii]
WKDNHSVYQGCNLNFAHFIGLNIPQDIVGKTDYDLPWTEDASDIYIAEDHLIVRTQQPILNKEVPLITETGENRFILVSKV